MSKEIKEEFNGASTIEDMEEASFPILPLPFNGSIVYCKVRCLNHLQLRAVGEFNLIDIRKPEEKDGEYTLQGMIDVVNWEENLVKETLIAPSFDEINDRVYGTDNRISKLKKRLNEIRELINTVEAEERKPLAKEADSIELYIGSLLPTDFMDAVTSWATGSNRTDIKKVTRDMLLEAAILAANGKDNPADHLTGNFLDFHKEEINKSAWIVYNEYLKDKQTEKQNSKGIFKNMRIIRGGKIKG
jgi:hypothetical protein